MQQDIDVDPTDTGGAVTSSVVATDPIWDAKGDLPVGTGSNTAAKLTVGANNTFLVPDSAQATGLKWISAAAARALLIPNSTPSSSSDTGTAGEIRWDANFIYVCTATNTWKRSALATW
jgi:hypothetical protein